MSDNLDTLLAEAGFTLAYRAPKQDNGAKVLKTLANHGKVIVFGSDATDDTLKMFADRPNVWRDTDHTASQIRAHVVTFAKSRKVTLAVTLPLKDTDGNVIGYGFARKAQ